MALYLRAHRRTGGTLRWPARCAFVAGGAIPGCGREIITAQRRSLLSQIEAQRHRRFYVGGQ
jgi:hypothetical protein